MRARPGRFSRLLARALAGSGVALFVFSATALGAEEESMVQSFTRRLEQAARAATNPLRALTGTEEAEDPRGDAAQRRARLNAAAAAQALPAEQDQGASPEIPPARADESTGRPQPRTEVQPQPQRPAQAPGREPAEKLENFALQANVILGDGRSVRGRIFFRAPEKLVVIHKSEDIEYRKTVRVRDLRSIEITQWKGEPQRRNQKGEWIYKFAPIESTLTLAGGVVLKENARLLPYFETMTMRNANGEVTLFSFWIDLLYANGTWYTGITGPSNGLRRTGHKDVIQRIEFGDTLDDHG